MTSPSAPATRALVWGPKFWFVLHSIAWNYPVAPTEVTKRKYYDTVLNLPLLPDREMGDRFAEMLELYPVSPYLCSRASFIRWTWFIHNKINMRIGKPTISLEEAVENYDTAMNTDPRATAPPAWFATGLTATTLMAICIVLTAIAAAMLL